MTKYHYTTASAATKHIFHEATTQLSPQELMVLIDSLPASAVIELEGRFVHAILLDGRRWDAHDREWKDLSEFFSAKETKPPLGIMPKKFWIEKRIADLKDTAIRYIQTSASNVNGTRIKELIDEIEELEKVEKR